MRIRMFTHCRLPIPAYALAATLLVLSAAAVGQTVQVAEDTQAGQPIKIRNQRNQTFENLRAYMGDFNVASPEGAVLPSRGRLQGSMSHALSIEDSQRVVIDRSAMMWGVSQNLRLSSGGTGKPVREVVVRNSINALSMRDNRHPKGRRGLGTLIYGDVDRVLFERCLMAHHWARALFAITVRDNDIHVEAANVIVYNWQFQAISIDTDSTLPEQARWDNPHRAKVNLRGCVFIVGPDTQMIDGLQTWFRFRHHPVYIEDCWVVDREGNWTDMRDWLSDADRAALADQPYWIDFRWAGYNPWSVRRARSSLVQELLRDVGPQKRNWIEQMVVDDVLNGTGRIIDSQDDLLEARGSQPGEQLEQINQNDVQGESPLQETAPLPVGRIGGTRDEAPERTSRVGGGQGDGARRVFRE